MKSEEQFQQRKPRLQSTVFRPFSMAFPPLNTVFGGPLKCGPMADKRFDDAFGIVDADPDPDRHQKREIQDTPFPLDTIYLPFRKKVEQGDRDCGGH